MKCDKMIDCINNLKSNIQHGIESTDLNSFFEALENIKEPTLVTGCGGSSVVGTFLAKVLREKNGIIATFATPRDMLYMNLEAYKNVISCSYSGRNIGVDVSFENKLNRYLFTGHPRDDTNNIIYNMKPEESYVSIGATFVPLSLLLLYYRNDKNLLDEILNMDIATDSKKDVYEVMLGYENATAGMMLESSITEGCIGACTLHDKYNYCHGRINLSRKKNSDMIFFKGNNELDAAIEEVINSLYDKVIVIENRYDDVVINDFYCTYMSLKLIVSLANNYGVDISDMKELPVNDRLYLFKGKMK